VISGGWPQRSISWVFVTRWKGKKRGGSKKEKAAGAVVLPILVAGKYVMQLS